jgi:hypothetical protein
MSKQILGSIFVSLSSPFAEISVAGDPAKKNIANLAGVFGPDDWNKLPKEFTSAFDAVIKAKSGKGEAYEPLFNSKPDKMRTNRAKVLGAYEVGLQEEVSAEDFDKVLLLNYAVKETCEKIAGAAATENSIEGLESFLVSIIEAEEAAPEVVAEAPAAIETAPEQGVNEIAPEVTAEVLTVEEQAENLTEGAEHVTDAIEEVQEVANFTASTNTFLEQLKTALAAGSETQEAVSALLENHAAAAKAIAEVHAKATAQSKATNAAVVSFLTILQDSGVQIGSGAAAPTLPETVTA